MQDGTVWLAQTNTVSCSDASIAPLVTSTARQQTGLSAANPSRSTATDERGNATETWTTVGDNIVTRHRRVPYATNVAETTLRYGDVVREVSVSGVTDTYAYDALGRQVSHADGRGNTSRTEYNVRGLRSASIDALGNRTAYAYDRYGNLSAVTNPLGNAVVYEYDLRGRRTYEGGATYPVRYTYDVFGNKTTMTTYRNESLGPSSGDLTTWRYDEASNCMTNKVYADGKGPKYGYTPDGRLAQRIWARGIVTDYAYDGWGSLTNTVYSDGTPTVTLLYDAMGRQTNAVDAAGVTTFRYDDSGSLTNETLIGVAGENTIIRHWDAYGRTAGYSLVGRVVPNAPQRQTTIGYDAATGRIATMLANGSNVPFTWSYLPGSDLKSSLAYPNGLTASWTYDANSQLLQVRNAVVATAPSPSETEVISQYDYVYDNAGRRVSCTKSGSSFTQNDALSYGYNEKSELTNAVAAVDSDYRYAYDFDEIGNRESANERGTNAAYMANQLNQYTAVDDFTPQFDDDGNQTLVKTATGIWTVAYNGENRPVLWTCGATSIVMKYDRMGRRVEYLETVDGGAAVSTSRHHRFVYDGYLCVQRLDASAGNAVDLVFAWDALEKVATRPLMIEKPGMYKLHVTHDGNKNVSELVFFSGGSGIAAHYEYAPFGAVTASTRSTSVTAYDLRTYNPFRFSSEYADDTLGLVYYNYRHYNPLDGRWTSRDPIGEEGGLNVYIYVNRNPLAYIDTLGLFAEGGDWCTCICGFLQMIGGGIEAAAGYSFAFLTAESGVGIAVGMAVGIHGSDVATAGFYTMINGVRQDTLTSQGLQATGVPKNWANGIDAGISMIGTMGVGAATRTAGQVAVATSSANTSSRVLGNSTFKGVSDDMLVHFSQAKNLDSIKANGITSQGGYSYYFRVGDVRNMSVQGVKWCIGPLAQGGEDIGLAVIVSPDAATFSNVGMEYLTSQNSVPWTLIRQIP